jgi:hypothetical protein
MASCRAPYAGVSRVRFQETLSTPFSGVPLAVHKKDKRAGLHRKFLVKFPKWPGLWNGRSGWGPGGCSCAYWVAKMNV